MADEPTPAKIRPTRIHPFKQCNFLRAAPVLEPFLACNRSMDVTRALEVDQPIHFVLLRKSRNETLLVFNHSTFKIVSHTDVQRTQTACHDIAVVCVPTCLRCHRGASTPRGQTRAALRSA